MRTMIEYENETAYLFDFTMFYLKVWKVGCQRLLKHKFITTYKFLCDIETSVYDLTKSLITDAESLKFRGSILVAALITASIEIHFKSFLD